MTTPKSNVGRKPLLTPEVEAEFFEARGMGMSLKRSAEMAGVSEGSINNWKARGLAASSMSANKRDAMDQKCVEFFRSLTKVDHEWIRRCELVLNLSMAPGESKKTWDNATMEEKRLAAETARWKLSHQAPNEYSTQTRTELTGADGGPIEVDATGMDVFNILLKVKAYEDEQEALEERNY